MGNEGMEDPSKQFDGVQAVDSISFAAEQGGLSELGPFRASLNNTRRRWVA